MSADPTKINYYSAYNSYKNLGVFPGILQITNSSIPAGGFQTWRSTILVEQNSRYATSLIQTNDDNFPSGVTPLRYASFPSATEAWGILGVDPDGLITLSVLLDLIINNNQVTFIATAFNPGLGNCAFNSFNIGFQYATHTLNI